MHKVNVVLWLNKPWPGEYTISLDSVGSPHDYLILERGGTRIAIEANLSTLSLLILKAITRRTWWYIGTPFRKLHGIYHRAALSLDRSLSRRRIARNEQRKSTHRVTQ